jgi:N-acetylglucosamine malate deacetylase 1
MNIDRVLILSPHTDDGEISCGGTIAKFIDEGKEVFYVAFSSCTKSVPLSFPDDVLKKECSAALDVLGIPKDYIFFFDFEVREFSKYRQQILD